MARARNIKPGFFVNEELVELPFATRLLFIGLWTLADREGRLEDRPKKIKMALFPADDVNVDNSLSELAQSKFIVRYEINDEKYIQIDQFVKHQNPHHMESPSSIPPMDGSKNKFNHTPISPKQRARIYERDAYTCLNCGCKENLQIDHIVLVSDGGTSDDDNLRTLCSQCNNNRSKKRKSQANPADSLIPESLLLIPESNKREAKNPDASASRLPKDWTAGFAEIEFCNTTRPELDVQDVADSFKDYWIAQPGAKGRKTDWLATWRNWVRNTKSNPGKRTSPSLMDGVL